MQKTLLTAAVAALTTGAASAGTLPFTVPFGPSAVPTAPFAVNVPQYDGSFGPLVGITITLDTSTSAGSIAWDNEATVTTDVDLGIGAEVEAVGPSALTLTAVPLQLGSALGVDADNDGIADFVGTDSFSVTGGTGLDSDVDVIANPGDFGPYVGVGTVPFTVSSSVQTFFSGTGGFGPFDSTPGVVEGSITIVYDYVPEPGVLGLAGLGGLAMLRRRRAA